MNQTCNQSLTVFTILLLVCFSHCGDIVENFERKLVKRILSEYDTAVRPSINATMPLNVTFGLSLTQIIDVDERNQILTTNCWLNQMWIDYSLRWDPRDYGGLKVVRIPATEVWRPDIILYNNADSQYNLAILSTNVIVTSDGNLTWLSSAIFKSSCQINVEYFPFDEQKCEMKFASWTYDGFQLNLVISTEEGDLSNYVSNGEWDLILMKPKRNVFYYSCCLEPYPDVTYFIVLRRRPLFYVFNLILPCVLISGLALLSFYMPSDSGEKVTLGITTLLSMTVFLMVIGESMPPTSEKLPLIGLYYGVTISIVSFATGLSVVTLNIHHRGMRGRALPLPVRKFIFNILARAVFLRLDFPKREEEIEPSSEIPGPRIGIPPTKLVQGETWRIVHPNMPSPSNSCSCEVHNSLLDNYNWRRGNVQRNVYSSYSYENSESEKCSTCCSGSNRSRPIMKVRGIQSDVGGSPPPLHRHRLHHHYMKTRDDLSLPTKYNNFDAIPPFSHPTPTTSTSSANQQPEPEWQRKLFDVLNRLVITMERNEGRMEVQDKKDIVKLEWQQAALVLDRFLLWIFVIATIGATFGILYMSPHSKLFFH